MIITDIRINNLLWSDLPNVCGKSVSVKFLTSTVYTVNPRIYIRGGHFILLISTLFLGRVRIVNLWNTNERALSSLFKFLIKNQLL